MHCAFSFPYSLRQVCFLSVCVCMRWIGVVLCRCRSTQRYGWAESSIFNHSQLPCKMCTFCRLYMYYIENKVYFMCISQDMNDKVMCFTHLHIYVPYVCVAMLMSIESNQKKKRAFSPFPRPLFILFRERERICDKLRFDPLIWWSAFLSLSLSLIQSVTPFISHWNDKKWIRLYFNCSNIFFFISIF